MRICIVCSSAMHVWYWVGSGHMLCDTGWVPGICCARVAGASVAAALLLSCTQTKAQVDWCMGMLESGMAWHVCFDVAATAAALVACAF